MSAMTVATKAKTKTKAKANKNNARLPLETNCNYSVPDGAAAAGVAPVTFWRAIYGGHLQHYRVGRRVILSGAQIKAWLDAGGRTSRVTKGGGERCEQ